MSVALSPQTERRNAKRFQISSPITVMLGDRGRNPRAEQGHLYDIGINGARFQLGCQLSVGQVLVLLVHFRDLGTGVTTVRFMATVTRMQAGSPIEIAVQFRRRGRFLRGRVDSLCCLENPTALKGDSSPWINW
jgi:PilZ domain-containing protein